MSVTKIPKSIVEAFKKAPRNTTRGSAMWISTLSETQQEEFKATVDAFLKGRAAGRVQLSIENFVRVLKTEFGYPFEWGALRSYMARHHSQAFGKQVLIR